MAVGSILPIFEVPQAQASAPGNLYGWGRNEHGQLGSGNFIEFYAPERLPAAPGGVADWNELYLRIYSHNAKAVTPSGELWVWGRNIHGQLGVGDTINRHTPVQNTNLPPGTPNWNYVEWIVSGYHNLVRPLVRNANNELVPDGRLFGWGRNFDGAVGLGHANEVLTPTPIPMPATMTAIPGVNNWGDVEFIETAMELTGTFVLVRTPNGQLFGWGRNVTGQIGLGHNNPVNAPTNIPMPAAMTALPGVNNWNDVEIIQGASIVYARTPTGQLFVWGQNEQGALGVGDTTNRHTPFQNTNLPPGVTNWNEIVRFIFHFDSAFLFTADGRKFAAGYNGHGNFGLGHNDNLTTFTPIPLTILPSLPNVSSWNDLDLVVGAGHIFAITPAGRMFAWGRNINGDLGLGHNTSPVNTPQENTNLPTGVRDWRDLELFTGGHNHTFARVRPLPPLPINKTLRLNEGTIVPGTPNMPAGRVSGQATFTFRFTPQDAIRYSDDPVRYSNTGVPSIADQTITIDHSTATAPVNGTFTATGNTVCIRALIYAHNPFPDRGMYVWELEELRVSPHWSGLHNPPYTYMEYDTTRFQIRAFANTAGIIETIVVYEMEELSPGNWQIVEPKLEALPFTNTYTRMVGDVPRAALYISKDVVGEMANLSLPFTFTLTLTNPYFTPPNIGNITASVVTGTPPVQVRTIPNITAGTNTFALYHGETLRIPELPAGTHFSITEAARAQFMPQASVSAIAISPSLSVPAYSGTYPQLAPNTPLTTSTYIIHQVDLNEACFINTYDWDVPAGLFITSTPWAAVGVATLLLLALLVTTRNRKRIEEIPLVL